MRNLSFIPTLFVLFDVCTPVAYNVNMVFKETSIFTKLIQLVMSDEEYTKLQEILVDNPKKGDVIKGSGGLRKIRWKASGKGKRSGVRVIYYHLDVNEQVFMLYAYKKNEQSDLTKTQLRVLKQVIEQELAL
ncbi:MAG: type II toxin-antitoxin system RelE/ParE family toxin [Coxiellaceae bacterium]|nr:type II toxin-antitoxin system RelE/ParE family toxin [Coxiellaceae bacterium]